MAAETQQRMHSEHRQWNSDNALWRDQVREWQQQTIKAVEDLVTIREALAKHERILETHAAAIRLYEQQSTEHEHELASMAAAAKLFNPSREQSEHSAEAYSHHEVYVRHETLKQQHHTLLARWCLLLQAIQTAT